MGITLADLKGKPKSVSLTLEGVDQPINVSYYPNYITPEMEETFNNLGEEKSSAGIVAILVSALASWDIEDVPCTPVGLQKVPTLVLAEIATGIFGDAGPKAISDLAGNASSSATVEPGA